MKKRAMFLLFICFCFIGISSLLKARMPSDLDGNDWLRANEWYKIGLISGLIIGVSLIDHELPIDIDDLIKDLEENDEFITHAVELGGYFKYLDKITLYNIKVGQIKDGLDEFYKDFTTRRIKIIDAIYVVKMQIEGKSRELIEAQILYLKKQPINDIKKQKAWNKYLNFILTHHRDPKYKDIIDGKISKEDLLTIGMFISQSDEIHNLFCYGYYE